MKLVTTRLTGVAALLTILAVASPSPGVAGIRPGIEVGLSLTTLNYDDAGFLEQFWDRGWRPSPSGGATIEIPLRERFQLMTGLRYVQQGNRVRYDTGPGAFRSVGEFRVVQSYLSIPALIAWRPLPTRRFRLSFGPELGLLLSGRLIVEESAPAARTEYDNIRKELDGANVSLDLGMGYEFPVENHVATVGIRYAHGLTGAAKAHEWISDWRTRSIEGLIGMRW